MRWIAGPTCSGSYFGGLPDPWQVGPILAGSVAGTPPQTATNPATGAPIGTVIQATPADGVVVALEEELARDHVEDRERAAADRDAQAFLFETDLAAL